MDFKFREYRDENHVLQTVVDCKAYDEILDRVAELTIDVENLLSECSLELKKQKEVEDKARREAQAKHWADEDLNDAYNEAEIKTMALEKMFNALQERANRLYPED